MKTKHILTVITLTEFALTGCETLKTVATPSNARIATAIACSNTLNFAVSNADRVEVANYIYGIAHGIRTLSGGKVPTPDELKQTVNLFTPNASRWVYLGTSISSVYGGIYAQVKGNPKVALDYLEAIAAGCEDAVEAYRTHTESAP